KITKPKIFCSIKLLSSRNLPIAAPVAPSKEKTKENPSMKKIVFSITCCLFSNIWFKLEAVIKEK
ncbi:MAG: hypothetical protein NZ870_02060, partial [bacterium]|nr:hypothetical protein [bacterium]